jgi:hypothetical protein
MLFKIFAADEFLKGSHRFFLIGDIHDKSFMDIAVSFQLRLLANPDECLMLTTISPIQKVKDEGKKRRYYGYKRKCLCIV